MQRSQIISVTGWLRIPEAGQGKLSDGVNLAELATAANTSCCSGTRVEVCVGRLESRCNALLALYSWCQLEQALAPVPLPGLSAPFSDSQTVQLHWNQAA